jgi:hypothetical protein
MNKEWRTYGRQDDNIYGFVGNPEGLRPQGRPRYRQEDNTNTDLRGKDGEIWIGLIWLKIKASGGLLWTR